MSANLSGTPENRTISATEFKAKCLEILDQLADHRLTRVSVTKRGRVVAVLTPPADEAAAVRELHGFLRDQVVLPADIDLTTPILDEPLLVERGLAHG